MPVAPAPMPFVGLSVKGALARSVVGRGVWLERRWPAPTRAIPDRSVGSVAVLQAAGPRLRAASASRGSLDLGGLPLDRRVRKVLEAQRKTFEELGCIVEDACPDFGDVDEIFLTLRTWASWNTYKDSARASIARS